MSAGFDLSRAVRSWLQEDEHERADHVLEIVLARLDSTPQRRSWWPARRAILMNLYARLAIGAAAVVVALVVGYQLLPGTAGPGAPTAAPSPSPVASPSPLATPPATLRPPDIPAAGPLSIGRHALRLEGVPFTLQIAGTGWTSNGDFGFDKPPIREPAGAAFIFWAHGADGVFQDPCAGVEAPPVGPTAADLAGAIAAMPQLELVSGPTAMTIGGRPAQHVVVRVPADVACAPEQFYLWYDNSLPGNARYATDRGSTISVWLIEVDGKRVQLDGETYAGAGPEVGAELDAIVASIQFD